MMIYLTNITCERSRASGAIRPTLKAVHLQLSALPLATRPLATARPCHTRPTRQPSVSPATQRPTSPNSASVVIKSLSGGRLALSPGRWRIVRKCKSHPAPGVPQCTAVVAAVLLCCRCGLVGTYCSTAVVLLWWWVGRWVDGVGGCVVGGGSLAIHEMAGGRKTTNLPAFLTVLRVLKSPESIKCSSRNGVPPYILLHCCTAVVAWSVGGGGARGWVQHVE